MRVFIGFACLCVASCSGGHGASSITDDDSSDVDLGDPNTLIDVDGADNQLGDSMTFVHIVCVGDSLTANAAYRGAISGDLEGEGRSADIHEVSQTGASSSIADELRERLEDFVPPDVAVIWTGLDDALASIDAATTLQAVSDMVGHLRDANPSIIVVIAEVPPVSDADLNTRVSAIDDGLAELVASLTSDSSPVVLVTDRDSFDPTTETDDGTHPNDAGGIAVGELAFAAFAPDLH